MVDSFHVKGPRLIQTVSSIHNVQKQVENASTLVF